MDDDGFGLRSVDELIGAEFGGCILGVSSDSVWESDMFISYMDVSVSDCLDCCGVAGDGEESTDFFMEEEEEEEGREDDKDIRFVVDSVDGSLLLWVVGVAGFDMEVLVSGAFNGIVADEEFVFDPEADNNEEVAVDGKDSFASVNAAVKIAAAVAFTISFWVVELAAVSEDVDEDAPFDFFGVLEEAAAFNGDEFEGLVVTTTVGGIGVSCADVTAVSAFCLLFRRKPTFTTPVVV